MEVKLHNRNTAYFGGAPKYTKLIAAEAAAGYPGFELR